MAEDGSEVLQNARVNAAQLPRLVDEAETQPTLRAQLAQLERRQSQIDRGALKQLEQDRLQIEASRRQHEKDQKEALEQKGTLARDARAAAEERQLAEEGLRAARTALEATAIAQNPERRAEAEARYLQEHAERVAQRRVSVFEHQRSIVSGEVNNLVQKMVELKTRFSNDYGFVGETLGEGYAEHDAERERSRESRLPDYRARIADAKRKATEQLAEDIIFRLRENLLLVQRQLDDLNRALKDVPFNGDRYPSPARSRPLIARSTTSSWRGTVREGLALRHPGSGQRGDPPHARGTGGPTSRRRGP